VYAYDTKTGERLWTYNATDPYDETLFSDNWWLYPVFITDGKIYYGHLEHSPNSPFPRGAPFLALDVETGKEVFRVNGMFRQTLWGGLGIIGDSIIVNQDTMTTAYMP
jgi:outer membrane protein assembly factor BamB